jgi:hypothetical protein
VATSGTATFNPDILTLIEEAYERAGVEIRTGYDLQSAKRSLDIMAQEWTNRGLNLWAIDEGTVALVAGTATYNLPADTIDLIDHVLRTGTGTSQVDYTLARIGVGTYAALTNKNTQARPLQAYVDRQATPTVTVWPVPDASYTLVYWRLRRIEDTGASTNTIDVPSRFIPAMAAGLAYYVAMKKPSATERVPFLKQVYDEQFRLAWEEDHDRSAARLVPG